MEEFLKISEVAARYGISKRTLRYYEEIGLLACIRKDGSDYRYYDGVAIARLEQILLLRRLDFPVNRIKDILLSDSNTMSNEIFYDRLRSLQDQIDMLVSLRRIVESIIRLNESGSDNINLYAVLRDQIYIHKKVERVLEVEQFTGDLLVIEFGIGLVPYAEQLIAGVKTLRSSIEKEHETNLPLIRIRDIESMTDNQYRILLKGIIAASGDTTDQATSNAATQVLRSLEQVIRNNMDNLIRK